MSSAPKKKKTRHIYVTKIKYYFMPKCRSASSATNLSSVEVRYGLRVHTPTIMTVLRWKRTRNGDENWHSRWVFFLKTQHFLSVFDSVVGNDAFVAVEISGDAASCTRSNEEKMRHANMQSDDTAIFVMKNRRNIIYSSTQIGCYCHAVNFM